MHRRALLRQEHGDHLTRRAGGEEALREQLHGDRCRALAHADEHRSVPDNEYVATLEVRRQRPAIAPELEVAAGEEWMVLVDRL